jgi:hypothetical protein
MRWSERLESRNGKGNSFDKKLRINQMRRATEIVSAALQA